MADASRRRFIIDSSFLLNYLMPDEQNEKVQEVFNQYKTGRVKLISVMILPFEVTNGLYAAIISKRISLSLAESLLREFLAFPISLETVDFMKTLYLAKEKEVSVYDASYVYLSKQTASPLLTLDKKLVKLASSH